MRTIFFLSLLLILVDNTSIQAQIITKKGNKIQNNQITGGNQQGKSLIHRFKKFNVGKNKLVNFITTEKTKNVYAIVSGVSKTNILGTISINSNTSKTNKNFILINPNGIVLGSDTKFNFKGSFIGSTASHISNINSDSFRLSFKKNPEQILVLISDQDSLISSGNSISLLGGEVNFKNSNINISGSNLEIGAFSQGSKLLLSSNQTGWNTNILKSLRAENIKLTDTLVILKDTKNINPNINLYGGNLLFRNVGKIIVDKSHAPKNKGIINLKFTDTINLNQSGNIESFSIGNGDSLPIKIEAKSLTARNSKIFSRSAESGPEGGGSGSIILDIKEDINLYDDSIISTQSTGGGNAGIINIESNNLLIKSGSSITGKTQETGSGGTLLIFSKNIDIDGEGSMLSANTEAQQIQGDAGQIEVFADSISVTNGGQINVSSKVFEDTGTPQGTPGNAGNISLQANDILVSGQGSEIIATSESLVSSGNLNIQTDQLILSDRGKISVSALKGSAGTISINANQIILNSRAKVLAETSSGKGDINIQNAKAVILNQQSSIETNATNTGDGGNITLDTLLLVGNDDSNILARAEKGTGGGVTINSPKGVIGFIENSQDSEITNDIVVTSTDGVDGFIEFQSPVNDPTEGISEKNLTVTDSSTLISQSCSQPQTAKDNQFRLAGKGGKSNFFDDYISSQASLSSWAHVDIENRPLLMELNSKERENIEPIEAEIWSYSKTGKVILSNLKAQNNPNLTQINSCT